MLFMTWAFKTVVCFQGTTKPSDEYESEEEAAPTAATPACDNAAEPKPMPLMTRPRLGQLRTGQLRLRPGRLKPMLRPSFARTAWRC